MSITKIALRKSGGKLTPYIGTYSQDGKVQKAFKAQIVPKVASCVKAKNKGVHSVSILKKNVSDCAKAVSGTKLTL